MGGIIYAMLDKKWRTFGIVVTITFLGIYTLSLFSPKINKQFSLYEVFLYAIGGVSALYFLISKKPTPAEAPTNNNPYYQKNLNLVNKFLKVTYVFIGIIIIILIFLFIKINFFD